MLSEDLMRDGGEFGVRIQLSGTAPEFLGLGKIITFFSPSVSSFVKTGIVLGSLGGCKDLTYSDV